MKSRTQILGAAFWFRFKGLSENSHLVKINNVICIYLQLITKTHSCKLGVFRTAL